VGHEGEGSILSNLKQLGWANTLGSMIHTSAAEFSVFCATIGLTDAGLEHISEIVTIFFEYIGLSPLPSSRWVFPHSPQG
jgi:insulysin